MTVFCDNSVLVDFAESSFSWPAVSVLVRLRSTVIESKMEASTSQEPMPKKSTDSMAEYISYFERISRRNKWDDSQMAHVFPAMLEVGNRSVDGLSDATLSSFARIKKAVLGENEPYRESNCRNFVKLRYNRGESMQEFRDRIVDLLEKSYPKFCAATKNALTRDFFIYSLPDDYQQFLMTAQNSKIDEAVNSAILFESMKKSRAMDQPRFFPARPQRPANVVNGAYRRPSLPNSPAHCFNCSKVGHLARNCPQRTVSYQNSNQKYGNPLNTVQATYYLPLLLGDVVEELLLDTGAGVCVLPASRYTPTHTSDLPLTLADGSTLKSYGTVRLPVSTLEGGRIGNHDFHIADVSKPYLGADLMEQKMDGVIHLRERYVEARSLGENIPFNAQPSAGHQSYPVVAKIDFIDDVAFLTDDVADSHSKPEGSKGRAEPLAEDNHEAQAVKEDTGNQARAMIEKYEKLFGGIGKTDLVQHFIPTSDNVPINLPSYRIPLHLKAKARKVINEYLGTGIIEPSNSEYCSPLLLIKKPNTDEVRVIIDYRALNAKSKRDAFSSPRADDLIDKLEGATVFTKLDVKAAFHNIEIAEEDRHKTAFRFDGKLYQWKRCPFGLSSAPATYNRLMAGILSPFEKFTAGYYDDVVVFSKSKEEHYKHLDLVLSALYKAGLKLNKDKCSIAVDSVNFLGFRISRNSVTLTDSKVDTIKKYPVPKSVKQVKRFLGLTGFYRKLVDNYAIKASPLNELTRKNVVFKWTAECQKSFEKLRNSLISQPILAMPNPNLPFIVKVDSSKFGVGCILEQENPETQNRHVIEYASKKYNDTEKQYPAIELEACGLIFAVKHWNHYLIGKHFIIETDSKAVEWIKGKFDHPGKLGRWSYFLENYDFTTVHVAGKDHTAPDALSRMHEDEIVIGEINAPFLENIFVDADTAAWKDEIESDTQLVKLIENSHITCKNDMYVKGNSNVLVLPKSVRNDVLTFLHDNLGHQGINKLTYRVKERYFWPNLDKDVKNFCKACHSCAINKDNKAPNSAPLRPIRNSTLEPFERVAIDILGPLPEADDGSKYLIVLQDYFTKWPEVTAVKSVESDTVQSWLTNEIIPRYGCFSELITDQGVQFVSEKSIPPTNGRHGGEI